MFLSKLLGASPNSLAIRTVSSFKRHFRLASAQRSPCGPFILFFFPDIAPGLLSRRLELAPACGSGRRAPRQDVLPAVPGHDCLAKDVDVLVEVHAVGRRHRPVFQFVQEPPTVDWPDAILEYAVVGFARVRECLALLELEMKQPLAPSGLAPRELLCEGVRGWFIE